VQAWLGHSHFNTTAKYLHISMRRLRHLPPLLEGLVATQPLPTQPLPTASEPQPSRRAEGRS
jgi:hypothetical protein